MSISGVSIIICTFNGIERLTSTFDSILKLNPGIARELILVDNASTDDIAGFCRNYFSENPSAIDFKLVKEKKAGLTYARIAGIRQANYEYLLFCDDDNALYSDYLQLGVKLFDDDATVGIVGGRGIPRMKIDPPDWFDKYQRSFAVGPQRSESGVIEAVPAYVYGAGAFFRKAPMLSILESGFCPKLTGRTGSTLLSGDDLEWCWLLQLLGYKIYYEDRLRFFHDLAAQRITEQYYLKLKSGTAAGSALIYAYRIFFENQNLTKREYLTRYKIESLKSWLRYLKNRIFKKTNNWEHELALAILRSRDQSFRKFTAQSVSLYLELKRLISSKQTD